MSSLINYIDLPRGAVFWHIDWIIDFTKSNYFSVISPVAEIILFVPSFPPVVFFFLPPNLPIAMLFWFLVSSASTYFYFFIYYYPYYINYWTFLLYSYFFLGFVGTWTGSSYFGYSTFSTLGSGFWIYFLEAGCDYFYFGAYCFGCCCCCGCCWGGSGFLFLAADGGLSIFFFSAGLAYGY